MRPRKFNPIALLGAILALVVTAFFTQDDPLQRRVPEPAPAAAQNEEQAEIQATLDLIARGGPFPHRQDGAVFQNREGRLPQQPRGYYREYTVRTPGAPNRGARRIVTGKNGEKWYTRDHYRTFVRLD